jgi:hypothetical protein
MSQKAIIVCSHRTSAGFYQAGEPICVVDPYEAETLGAAVLDVMHASGEYPDKRSGTIKIIPLILQVAGVRSWKKFEAATKECHVESDGQQVQIAPCVRIGGGRGMHLQPETAPSDAASIGRTLEKVFSTLP